MQPIAEQIEERVVPFLFPNPAKAFASPLIRLEGAAVGYVAGQPVLQGLDLRLDADDRVGLLGANGNGKSTFAKLICGAPGADGRPPLCAPTRSRSAISPSTRWTTCPPARRPTSTCST